MPENRPTTEPSRIQQVRHFLSANRHRLTPMQGLKLDEHALGHEQEPADSSHDYPSDEAVHEAKFGLRPEDLDHPITDPLPADNGKKG